MRFRVAEVRVSLFTVGESMATPSRAQVYSFGGKQEILFQPPVVQGMSQCGLRSGARILKTLSMEDDHGSGPKRLWGRVRGGATRLQWWMMSS